MLGRKLTNDHCGIPFFKIGDNFETKIKTETRRKPKIKIRDSMCGLADKD